jgi:hypothetical protein
MLGNGDVDGRGVGDPEGRVAWHPQQCLEPSAGEGARNPGDVPRAVRRIFAGREDSELWRLRGLLRVLGDLPCSMKLGLHEQLTTARHDTGREEQKRARVEDCLPSRIGSG